ncbi:hypothetical protein BKA80DRAFT_304384 [Phyllosticta citrichinensis]
MCASDWPVQVVISSFAAFDCDFDFVPLDYLTSDLTPQPKTFNSGIRATDWPLDKRRPSKLIARPFVSLPRGEALNSFEPACIVGKGSLFTLPTPRYPPLQTRLGLPQLAPYTTAFDVVYPWMQLVENPSLVALIYSCFLASHAPVFVPRPTPLLSMFEVAPFVLIDRLE